MFGLTFEKLFFVAAIAGFVLGPTRLPGYALHLARAVRTLRHFVESTRTAAEREMGVGFSRTDWESWNLQHYDPRRIVSDAFDDESRRPGETAPDPSNSAVTHEGDDMQPGRRYLVTGTSAHPRRILVDSLPEDDPRRIAARTSDRA